MTTADGALSDDVPPQAQARWPWRRLYRSTWGMLAAALAAFGYLAGVGESLDEDPTSIYEVYEHGWPWTFGYRFFWTDSKPLVPIVHTFSAYDGGRLAADVAVALALAVLTAAAWQWRRRRNRAWQFSLREALLLTTLVAAALSWWRWHHTLAAEEERLFLLNYRQFSSRSLQGANGAAGTDEGALWAFEIGEENKAALAAEDEAVREAREQPRQPLSARRWRQTAPLWMQRLLPRRWLGNFVHIASCEVSFTAKADAALAEDLRESWRRLPYCSSLCISRQPAANAIAAAVVDLPHLESVEVACVKIDPSILAQWKDNPSIRRVDFHGAVESPEPVIPSLLRISNLKEVCLADAPIRDADLVGIGQLRNLRFLRLNNTYIKGPGLRRLASLKNLRSLSLQRNWFHREAIEAIARLQQLEELDLQETTFSEERLPQLLGMKNLRSLRLTPTMLFSEESPGTLLPDDPRTGELLSEHPVRPTRFDQIESAIRSQRYALPVRLLFRSLIEEPPLGPDIPDWVRDWGRNRGWLLDDAVRFDRFGGMGFM